MLWTLETLIHKLLYLTSGAQMSLTCTTDKARPLVMSIRKAVPKSWVPSCEVGFMTS